MIALILINILLQRLGCLQFLKTSGGKLDECDNDGNTPAHLAAMEGNLHCLKYILSNAPNMSSLISARNDQVMIFSFLLGTVLPSNALYCIFF